MTLLPTTSVAGRESLVEGARATEKSIALTR